MCGGKLFAWTIPGIVETLGLPHNSIRVLVGCCVAAAISASFNTPVAGVIFSMEVIVMEYTIAGFIPVIRLWQVSWSGILNPARSMSM